MIFASGGGGSAALLVIVLFVMYWLPTIVAFARGKRNPGSVVVINLFLRWTVVGWVVALAMAFGG